MEQLIFQIMTFDLLIFIFFKSDILIYFLHLKNEVLYFNLKFCKLSTVSIRRKHLKNNKCTQLIENTKKIKANHLWFEIIAAIVYSIANSIIILCIEHFLLP